MYFIFTGVVFQSFVTDRKNLKLRKINKLYGPYVLNIITGKFEYKVTQNL